MTKPRLHILQSDTLIHITSLIEHDFLFEHFEVTKSPEIPSDKVDLIYTQTYANRKIFTPLQKYEGKTVIHVGADVWYELEAINHKGRLKAIEQIMKRASCVMGNSKFIGGIIKDKIKTKNVGYLPGGLWGTDCTVKGVQLGRFRVKENYKLSSRPIVSSNISVGVDRKYLGYSIFLAHATNIADKYGVQFVNTGKIKGEICEDWKNRYGVAQLGIRTDWPNILYESDIFVHPSTFDCFPRAACEAMCVGLPCLFFDTAGTSEVGSNVLYVDPQDFEAIAFLFEQLLTKYEFRESLGKRAREEAEEKTERHRRDYLNFLLEIVETGKPPAEVTL